MIGQQQVLTQIDNLVVKGFPRFIILTGQKGQGKTEIAKYISNKLNYSMIEIEPKIDNIREMIQMAYKQIEPIIYLIQNADKMSIGAKNSLLKVIEEPPNNAYFIMELQQIENTLETIKSRCQEIQLQNYTDNDIAEMIIDSDLYTTNEERVIIEDIAQNKYQIDLFVKYNPVVFYNYVHKVVTHIYRVSSANSFKLAEMLDLTDSGENYDIGLFWETFKNICFEQAQQLIEIEVEKKSFISYLDSIKITSKYLQKLKINGINKQALVDKWILDIRKVWRDNGY